jgi:hypothetical protein
LIQKYPSAFTFQTVEINSELLFFFCQVFENSCRCCDGSGNRKKLNRLAFSAAIKVSKSFSAIAMKILCCGVEIGQNHATKHEFAQLQIESYR